MQLHLTLAVALVIIIIVVVVIIINNNSLSRSTEGLRPVPLTSNRSYLALLKAINRATSLDNNNNKAPKAGCAFEDVWRACWKFGVLSSSSVLGAKEQLAPETRNWTAGFGTMQRCPGPRTKRASKHETWCVHIQWQGEKRRKASMTGWTRSAVRGTMRENDKIELVRKFVRVFFFVS